MLSDCLAILHEIQPSGMTAFRRFHGENRPKHRLGETSDIKISLLPQSVNQLTQFLDCVTVAQVGPWGRLPLAPGFDGKDDIVNVWCVGTRRGAMRPTVDAEAI